MKETKKLSYDYLNVGDKVEYKGQNAVVVDHYGSGNYAIEVDVNWIPVNENDLTIKEEVI